MNWMRIGIQGDMERAVIDGYGSGGKGRLDYLLGGRRDIRQRLRVAERERENSREREECIVRYIYEADGIVRESVTSGPR